MSADKKIRTQRMAIIALTVMLGLSGVYGYVVTTRLVEFGRSLDAQSGTIATYQSLSALNSN